MEIIDTVGTGVPRRIHVFVDVDKAVAVGVSKHTIVVGCAGRIQIVGHFPAIGHAIVIRIPTIGILINCAVAIVVVTTTVCVAVVVGISRINKAIVVVVDVIVTHVAHWIFVGAIGTLSRDSLHCCLLIPISNGDSSIPPDAIVEKAGRASQIPTRGFKVRIFL